MSVNCPMCNNVAMPAWKKIFMSPIGPVPCDSCDCYVRVTWTSYLLAISLGSMVFLLAYLQLNEGSLNQYLGYGLGFVLMLAGQVFFMPIYATEVPSKSDE